MRAKLIELYPREKYLPMCNSKNYFWVLYSHLKASESNQFAPFYGNEIYKLSTEISMGNRIIQAKCGKGMLNPNKTLISEKEKKKKTAIRKLNMYEKKFHSNLNYISHLGQRLGLVTSFKESKATFLHCFLCPFAKKFHLSLF